MEGVTNRESSKTRKDFMGDISSYSLILVCNEIVLLYHNI